MTANRLNDTYLKYKLELDELKSAAHQLAIKIREKEAQLQALLDAGAEDTNKGISAIFEAEERTLTQKVLDIINESGPEKGLRRLDIQKILIGNGYKPVGDNFKVTLFKTLMRLMKQKKITGFKNDADTWYFRAIPARSTYVETTDQ